MTGCDDDEVRDPRSQKRDLGHPHWCKSRLHERSAGGSAHFFGFSPTVTEILTNWPPRTMSRLMGLPTFSLSRKGCRLCMPWMGEPSTETRMSPRRMPEVSAGLPG